MTGVHPLPYDAMFCSTKAFSDFLSQCFYGEYKKIDFISLRPFLVSTKMVFNKEKDMITLTPEECAEGCFEDLGYKSSTYGHYKHAIQGFVYDLIPDSVIILVLRFIGPLLAKDYAEKTSLANKKE
jgi:short-subunit dehydrogenase